MNDAYLQTYHRFETLIHHPNYNWTWWKGPYPSSLFRDDSPAVGLVLTISKETTSILSLEHICLKCRIRGVKLYQSSIDLSPTSSPDINRKILDLEISRLSRKSANWRVELTEFADVVGPKESKFQAILTSMSHSRATLRHVGVDITTPDEIEVALFALVANHPNTSFFYHSYYNLSCHEHLYFLSFPKWSLDFSSRLVSNPPEHFGFITCGGEQPGRINFTWLYSSYDVPSWIAIILSFGLLGVLLHSLVVTKLGANLKLDHNVFELGFRVLLEQGDEVAVNTKRFGFMYWICAPLILAAVVISNAYKGKNITDLSAPILPRGVANWEELLAFDKPVFTIYSRKKGYLEHLPGNRIECMGPPEMKSGLIKGIMPVGFWDLYEEFDARAFTEYEELIRSEKDRVKEMNDKDNKFFNVTLRARISRYPDCYKLKWTNFTVYHIVANCSQACSHSFI